jgi:hypothetical protein
MEELFKKKISRWSQGRSCKEPHNFSRWRRSRELCFNFRILHCVSQRSAPKPEQEPESDPQCFYFRWRNWLQFIAKAIASGIWIFLPVQKLFSERRLKKRWSSKDLKNFCFFSTRLRALKNKLSYTFFMPIEFYLGQILHSLDNSI